MTQPTKGKLEYQAQDEDETWGPIACGDHAPHEEHDFANCEACDDNLQVEAARARGEARKPDLTLKHKIVKVEALSGTEGHDPECVGCVLTAENTLEHREAVHADRRRGKRELRRRLAAFDIPIPKELLP